MLESNFRQRLTQSLRKNDTLGVVQALEIITGRGFPDVMYVNNKSGHHFFLELKVKGNRPSPIQEQWGRKYNSAIGRANTGEYAVVTQLDKDTFCYCVGDASHTFTFKGLIAYLIRDTPHDRDSRCP